MNKKDIIIKVGNDEQVVIIVKKAVVLKWVVLYNLVKGLKCFTFTLI